MSVNTDERSMARRSCATGCAATGCNDTMRRSLTDQRRERMGVGLGSAPRSTHAGSVVQHRPGRLMRNELHRPESARGCRRPGAVALFALLILATLPVAADAPNSSATATVTRTGVDHRSE